MKKLRVGVLMGGKSLEHEVSFNSGRTICDHLDTARFTIVPIFQTLAGSLYILPWHFLHRGKTTDFTHRLTTEAEAVCWDDLKELIDFAYIALHGKFAEDGTVQGFFEVLGIPYLGSDIFASAAGMHKIAQKQLLRMHNIEVPRGIIVYPHELEISPEKQKACFIKRLEDQQLSLPLVIKPYAEGSSLGVGIVHTWDELYPALKKACSVNPQKPQAVLIEEKLDGMEFSCILLTDYKTGTWYALPPTEVIANPALQFFDYEQKYMPGKCIEYTPARCSADIIQQIQQTCIASAQALGFTTLARIDGFVTRDNRIVIIDPNSLSGMAPASFLFRQASECNMNHTDVINHLIETELHAYGMLDTIIAREHTMKNTQTQKLRVAVLLGGNTNEREISLESGRNVLYKLSPQKYEGIPLFVDNAMNLFKINQQILVCSSTKEIEQRLDSSMQMKWSDLSTIADFVFIALHGGLGENGGVQGTLEMLDLPYNGSSVFTSALCMDKYKTSQFLKSFNFHVPAAFLISQKDWALNKQSIIEKIQYSFALPLIIKPHDDGCSVLVHKVLTITDAINAIDILFSEGKQCALIEEYITGMELTVGVIGNQEPCVFPPSQAVSTSGILSIEEKFLPGAGENQTPAPLPPEALSFVQQTIAKIYTVLGCKGYARIDCFYQTFDISSTGQQRVVFIECNTLPGMTPATCIFHQAAEIGLKPMDLIDTIITLGLQEHTHYTHPEHEIKHKITI